MTFTPPRTIDRRLQVLLATIALVAVQFVLGTPNAHAYSAVGRPWPGGTITYWSTLPASYAWSTNAAIRAWNTSGARVRFVRASSATRAQVIIRVPPRGVQMEGAAQAQLGYAPGRRGYVWIGSRAALSMTDWDSTARLMAHELGHVVGLHHSDPDPPGCAIMKTYLHQCQVARPPRDGMWYCRMLFREDIAGVIRLYGRRARPAGTPNYCAVIPAPKQLVGANATGGEHNTQVRLSWTNPGLRASDRVQVEVHEAACGAVLSRQTLVEDATLGPGAVGWTDGEAPDRTTRTHCYVVQAVNFFGLGAPKLRLQRTLTVAPPTIGELTPVAGPEIDYTFSVGFVSDRSDLVVRRAPSGACATSATLGEAVSSFGNGSGTYSIWDLPEGAWCLSFFATGFALPGSEAPTSDAVTRELVHVAG